MLGPRMHLTKEEATLKSATVLPGVHQTGPRHTERWRAIRVRHNGVRAQSRAHNRRMRATTQTTRTGLQPKLCGLAETTASSATGDEPRREFPNKLRWYHSGCTKRFDPAQVTGTRSQATNDAAHDASSVNLCGWVWHTNTYEINVRRRRELQALYTPDAYS